MKLDEGEKFRGMMPLSVKAVSITVVYKEDDDTYEVGRTPILGIAATTIITEDERWVDLHYLIDGDLGPEIIRGGRNSVHDVFFPETETEAEIQHAIEGMKPKAKNVWAWYKDLDKREELQE